MKPLSQTKLLILRAISDQPKYGFKIIQQIDETTGHKQFTSLATLYGDLRALVGSGFAQKGDTVKVGDTIRQTWRITPTGLTEINLNRPA